MLKEQMGELAVYELRMLDRTSTSPERSDALRDEWRVRRRRLMPSRGPEHLLTHEVT